jgi:long-chain acyl-CoA synthetase
MIPALLTLADLAVRRAGRVERVGGAELVGSAHALALALEGRALAKGDRAVIFAENGPEWPAIELACHLLGAVVVPLAPRLPAARLAYVLRSSGARWIFYGAAQAGAVGAAVAGATEPPQRVALDDRAAEASAEGATALVPLLGEGEARRAALPLERLRGRVAPEDPAAILYSRGDGGEPRGVVLAHGDLVAAVAACEAIFPLSPDDRAVACLPLALPAERVAQPLYLHRGVAVHYVAGSERASAALAAVRPTVFAAPSRLYELEYRRFHARLARRRPSRQRLARWAMAVGQRHAAAREAGFVGPWLGARQALARLLLADARARFGGRVRFAIAAGPPLSPRLHAFFAAAGVPVFNGWLPTGATGRLDRFLWLRGGEETGPEAGPEEV